MEQTNNKNEVKKRKTILLDIVEEINNENTLMDENYEKIRNQYSNSEFIPSSLIPIIMRHHFPSSELLLSFSETHGLYKIMIKDLLNEYVKNWQYNRPPDLARCPDIARYIYNAKKQLDSMLYLTFTNLTNTFEVLDGIHRLTALKFIKEENSKQLELLCPGDFGSNNDASWLFNMYLIVNIRFNSNLGELIEVFTNLNKSQTVPDLYIRDQTKEKRQIIENIVNDWFKKYKKHFSSSANPINGNTNRNKFVDLLDKLYDKHKIDETNPNKLRKLLEDANHKIINNIPIKASIDVRLKCKESGCYLFLYKNDKLEDFI
jgi:hypothetical protein